MKKLPLFEFVGGGVNMHTTDKPLYRGEPKRSSGGGNLPPVQSGGGGGDDDDDNPWKKEPFDGTDEEAAELIVAFYMTNGEETQFIEALPFARQASIAAILKSIDPYVYEQCIEHFDSTISSTEMINIESKGEIKKEGIGAFDDGVSRDDCPYDDQDDIATWQAGWDVSKDLADRWENRED
jgi:ribosome modulation factor